jgi:ketosteroid isomerase-like protein
MTLSNEHMLPGDQVRRWIQAYGQAWRDKDADAVVALFTADATYRANPTAPRQRADPALLAARHADPA